ncbi:spore maturation protein CgeB [Cytobacillus eiseniae]|uniref:Spore maturation protein CgeB n=1 Tax=Cytobacillus eiseniae TaxID=762947 RepID=A0ABS4RBK0_9BACI|nr:glycosyltransferase [Cytobacillus eiseniae]MBP2240282.1 spore maturation protein CgeB [Cytobacillus eiseniae]
MSNLIPISSLRIACILDEFSFEALNPDSELIPITPNNWQEVLIKKRPHFLFVESAWNGNSGSWQYRIASYSNSKGNELKSLIKWCNQMKIPTVFWNKEDPIHFDRFIETAKLFDYVFTTDANLINIYKKRVQHERVYPLLFAAQPLIHNPINQYRPKKNVSFAGTYYANRHEERAKDMVAILDAALEHGLEIFDRNYHLKGKAKQVNEFPLKYRKHIVGHRPYNKLLEEYKNYKVFLNVNTVKNSSTMFSRRVFEIAASGTPILSSYAKGIEVQMGNIVQMASTTQEAKQKLKTLLNDNHLRMKLSLEGQRLVFSKHTYKHRLYEVATRIGLNVNPIDSKVIVLSMVKSLSEYQSVIRSFKNQTYETKSLLVYVPAENIAEISKYCKAHHSNENIKLLDLSKLQLYTMDKNAYYTYFSPLHYYGSFFITDMVHSLMYSGADISTKVCYFQAENAKILIQGKHEECLVKELQYDACVTKYQYAELIIQYMLNGKKRDSNQADIYASNRYNFSFNGNLSEALFQKLSKDRSINI